MSKNVLIEDSNKLDFNFERKGSKEMCGKKKKN